MTTPESEAIRNWLNTEDGQKTISDAAEWLLKNKRFKSFFEYFGIGSGKYKPGEVHNPDVDTLKSELVVFLLKRPKFITEISDSKSTAKKLELWFFNYCRDRERKLGNNNFLYMIKYVGGVIRKSEKLKTSAIAGQGTWFSNTDTDSKSSILYDAILKQIPFPMEICGHLDFDAIRNSETMIRLAEYFAESVSSYFGKPMLVGLNDFVRWLTMHVFMLSGKEMRAKGEERDKNNNPDNLVTGDPNINAEENDYDNDLNEGRRYFQEKIYYQGMDYRPMLKGWAEKFFNRLDHMQKKIFYLKYCKEKTLSKIADETGFKGPSGVSYRLEEINDKLRFFLSDLPMVSPEPDGTYDKEAFLEFIEYLKFFLKKEFEAP